MLAVVLAACGGAPKPGVPTSEAAKADDIKITGDASTPVNKLAISAIADLQKYWAEEYPKLYGSDYKPVAGGFFAVVPSSMKLPPCVSDADEIRGNAFYCPSKDVVAWDSENLLPDLQSRFGDFVIPIVLATSGGDTPFRPVQFHRAHGHQGIAGRLLRRRLGQARQRRGRL